MFSTFKCLNAPITSQAAYTWPFGITWRSCNMSIDLDLYHKYDYVNTTIFISRQRSDKLTVFMMSSSTSFSGSAQSTAI